MYIALQTIKAPFSKPITGDSFMAVNFRIQRHRKNDELHLNLIGDFDGSSAMELLHELRRHVGKAMLAKPEKYTYIPVLYPP